MEITFLREDFGFESVQKLDMMIDEIVLIG
jgi:hypothetical protein